MRGTWGEEAFLDWREIRWSGVGKPKWNGGGFSTAKPAEARRQPIKRHSADHNAAKEQQAVALINRGKLQEAEAIYKDLIANGSKNHIVYGNLAAICGMEGRFDELIKLLNKALEIQPNYPSAHNNLGTALKQQGNIKAAINSYNKALELKPNYPDAHYNLGNIFREQGNLHAAISSYNKVLELKPNHPDAHNNLGNVFKEQGNLDAAIASYKKALEVRPNHPETHSLSNALKEQGHMEAAITSYDNALKLAPDLAGAQWNTSICLLQIGDYKNGLAGHEIRREIWGNQEAYASLPPSQEWRGESNRDKDKLLLVCEQGLGDTLQFMRYAIALRKEAKSISLCAQPKLHSLIQASGIDPAPLSPEQSKQLIDARWIPLLSVPRHLGVNRFNPIITSPYIKTSDTLIKKWAKILSVEQRPIVGINWQGDRNTERKYQPGRSLPLTTFAPIAKKTKATLLSLQKGFGSEQLESCSFKNRFVSCQVQVDDTWDFLETAAIIANCDLVITSDTAMAHLAGGMDKTTWLLLKKVPDWRWGLEGETTFWYPSMRLFRQRERNNWDGVMAQVTESLQEHFRGI